jgi:hypothetical protein
MRLQPIENLSKTYSGDPHLGQTKLNGLLLLTIHGVLSGHQGGIKCANRRTGFIDSEGSHQSQDPKDPKHMLFCHETAFVRNRKAIDRTEKLSLEQKCYR